MPTDIFPNIDIPVVTVVWNFTGLSADQMSTRIVSNSERGMTTTVNDIEHIESQSLNGIAIIKIFFQPKVNIGVAVSQVTAICQVQLRSLPPGSVPPFIIQYNASSVPVLQLGLSGQGLNEQQLNDLATNNIRTQLATIEGAQTPYPYGGKQRQIMVDLNLPALQAKGLSPADVVNAISAQNIIAPSGTMKIDRFEYAVETNSAPSVLNDLNNLPIKAVNGAVIYIRDVAHVRDGNPPQTNIVRVDGKRAILMNVLKTGSASTLDIIAGVRAKLAYIKGQLPPQLRIDALSDQSIFVRSAIDGVVREAIVAACLTAIMILVFLGSWRSTVIIAVSIPLSILCSLSVLAMLHETINIMTLGGMALAVGILVDDATVAIENINRNLEAGKELEQSILDGSAQIAIPALVSTLAICIVFVPMFFLSGVARYLFVPMAEAVVFAMLASYLLSRTLVPTMAKYLLQEHDDAETARKLSSRNPFVRFQLGFESGFDSFRRGYLRLLAFCVDHAGVFLILFLVFTVGSIALLAPWLGQDFFPSVDSGQFKIHVRARTGTRIEETAALCDHIDSTIREHIPANEIVTIVDNIGLPYSGLNLSYSTSAPIGPADADIQVQLSQASPPHRGRMSSASARCSPASIPASPSMRCRWTSSPRFSTSASPRPSTSRSSGRISTATALSPSAWPMRSAMFPARPTRASSSPSTTPTSRWTWTAPAPRPSASRSRTWRKACWSRSAAASRPPPASISTPGTALATTSPSRLRNIGSTRWPRSKACPSPAIPRRLPPGGSAANGAPGAQPPVQVLGNLASITPGAEMGTVSHYDIQPVIDIYANVDGTDLGTVTKAVEEKIALHQKNGDLPRGSHFVLRGQSETMKKSYTGLLGGLVVSILLVYLLIVVNFQSWLDPFLIICRAARRAGRHRLVPLPHQHPAQRARAHRRHHVHGRGHGQLHSGRQLCPRAAGSPGRRRPPGRAQCRLCPPAPGADDRPGHDHRHGAHGPRPGRRRRAECPAGPRRHRRPAAGHRGHALLCARILLSHPRLARRPPQNSLTAFNPPEFQTSLTRFRSNDL